MLDFTALENKINYFFKDKGVLIEALTHKSTKSHRNYERLEFLGDSILNIAISLNLYKHYADVSEGDLSRMRAVLINQNTLYNLGKKISIEKYVFFGDAININTELQHSIVADVMEALFAAIFFDSNLENAIAIIQNLYQDLIKDAYHMEHDSKSLLQEYLQARKISPPLYKVIDLSGPPHDCIFQMQCSIPELHINTYAKAKNKKEATQLAAHEALILLKNK